MKFFQDIYGNTAQKSLFEGLIREGRLSHCYILEAPQGGGKKMMALRLAATLALENEKNDEGLAKCERILSLGSPDVKILRRAEDKKTIGIDAVREFVDSVYLTPSELDFKMYIFDEADLITPQAQNALLKVIEEPPRDVYLIFLCENALSLLTTVRSRGQRVRLERFSEEALTEYALRQGLGEDREKLAFAIRMANGAIGRLREVLEKGETEFAAYQAAKSTVESQGERASGKGGGYHAFLRSITELAASKEAFESYTAFLITAYGDLIGAERGDGFMPVFFTKEETERLSSLLSLRTVKDSFAAANEVYGDLRFHVNGALAAARLGMALWAAV